MFYCDECAKPRGWPETLARSTGTCETCGKVAVCNDCPSKYLPIPPPPIGGYGKRPKRKPADEGTARTVDDFKATE